jgi:hypothetical protein
MKIEHIIGIINFLCDSINDSFLHKVSINNTLNPLNDY